MLDKDLSRHAREFHGYLQNHQYDVTDDGVLFPKAGAVASGEYFYDTNGENCETAPNLLSTQALNYLLEAGTRGGVAHTQWYLALFSGAITPTAGMTADNFTTTATEITSASEGYSEPTRRPWAGAAASVGASDNLASRAAFTIVSASELTIRGAALLSDQTKGGASGILLSAARFPNARTESQGNVFNLGYRVRLRPE